MFLNYSRASLFHSCKRKFFWSHLFEGKGLRADQEPEYFTFGSAVHTGLAALGLKDSPKVAAARARAAYLKERSKSWSGALLAEWTEAADWVARTILTYGIEQHPKDIEPIVDVEQSFAVPLGEICHQCGRDYSFLKPGSQECDVCSQPVNYWVGIRDRLLKRGPAGHYAVQDHKTTKSTPDDNFMEKFRRSFQLLGYVYGTEKEKGIKVKEYGVNAIQKAKTIGTEQSVSRACPACRNGSKKKLTCLSCGQSGKVEKVVKLEPFRRKWFSVNDGDIDRFVLFAHKTIKAIEHEQEMMKTEPEIAFEMNDRGCSNCEFKAMCWDNPNALKWYEPPKELIEISGVSPRSGDYVKAFEEVAREEVV